LIRYLNKTSSSYSPACKRPVRSPGRRTIARFALLALLGTFAVGLSFVWAVQPTQISYAEQPAVKEYELKAVYLYNFLQFVQWPEGTQSRSKDGTMIIGILGDSPFGESLDDLRKEIRERNMAPVKFVYFGTYEDVMRESRDISGCHLLFLCPSEQSKFARIIADLNDAPVLTVADTENFTSSGGMISLVQNRGKIRWVVNRTAMEKAGLRVSAQLLSMAVKVVGGK